MIVLARESRGLSQKELAAKLGVPQSRISMIEMQLRPISDDLIGMIAKILDYPLAFFWQVGAINGIGIAEIFHRKRHAVPKRTLDTIYARCEIRFKHLNALLISVDVETTVNTIDVNNFPQEPREIAQMVRASLHIPRGPIIDVTDVLENAGIIVIAFDFETTRVDALSRWIPHMPPIIFVNTQCPKDRLRFSLAHELGHVVMHTSPNPYMEQQADDFAAEFLLPEREVRLNLAAVDLAQLAVLKQYWKVSMAALLKRAEDLEIITPNRVRYLWAQMARLGYKTREPVELDIKGEEPKLVKEIIDAHLNELDYTMHDLLEILPLHENELKTYYWEESRRKHLKLVK